MFPIIYFLFGVVYLMTSNEIIIVVIIIGELEKTQKKAEMANCNKETYCISELAQKG
jgi:hypothetical protein